MNLAANIFDVGVPTATRWHRVPLATHICGEGDTLLQRRPVLADPQRCCEQRRVDHRRDLPCARSTRASSKMHMGGRTRATIYNRRRRYTGNRRRRRLKRMVVAELLLEHARASGLDDAVSCGVLRMRGRRQKWRPDHVHHCPAVVIEIGPWNCGNGPPERYPTLAAKTLVARSVKAESRSRAPHNRLWRVARRRCIRRCPSGF